MIILNEENKLIAMTFFGVSLRLSFNDLHDLREPISEPIKT